MNGLGWKECIRPLRSISKLETAEHYRNSAVEGSSLSGTVTGGTDILDTAQCLRVRNVSGRLRLQQGGKQGVSNGGREGLRNTELKSYQLQIRSPHIPRCFGAHIVIHPFDLSLIHFAVCLKTDPQPLPKPVLHRVRSSSSSFNFQYPLMTDPKPHSAI